MRLIQAIYIDVTNKTVTKIKIKTGLQAIYNMIGCGVISALPIETNNDALYYDDEGLFNEIKGAFMFPDWNTPIIGNALIIGTDENGVSISCKSNVTDFNKIRFIDKDNPNLKNYVDQF